MYGTTKIESFYQYIPLNDGWGVALSSQSGFSSSVTQVLTVTSDPRRRNPSIWDSGYKSVFDERARMKTSRHLSAVVKKPPALEDSTAKSCD